jgi:hypothetical protein
MKNIQDLLKRNASRRARGGKKELDEKTIGRVFFEAAKEEIENLESEDIRELKIKEKTLYIKTAHPVISSELFLRKEKILKKTNEIAGSEAVDKVIIG